MFLQFLINGIISGSLIGIMAIGYWFIYRSTNIFHIAHGAVYTVCGYIFYTLYANKGYSLITSGLISIIFAALIGVAIYFIIYRPLEKKNASSGIKFISSLAVYTLIINIIAMIYGNDTKILSKGLNKSFNIKDIILIDIQIYQFIIFLFIAIVSFLLISKTKIGRTIRAMSDNQLLFKVLGLNEKLVNITVFSIGSAFAGACSIITGLDVGIDPHIGMMALLNAAIAVIIGGVKKIEGIILGSLLIGILQNFIIWQFSARWESAVTFLMLMIVLLYKSGGLFIIKRRVEES